MIKTQLIQKNYTKGGNVPKYIVIHNTDNPNANAQQHFKYWNTNDKANSSAHYVLDDNEIIKLVNHGDTAWHCGKKYGVAEFNDCTNRNSIGIEICNHNGCDFNKAMENAINLVKKLMAEHNIPAERVITHFQACRKTCPSTILKLNKWDWFKSQLVSKPTEPPKVDDKLYRVCVGSYANRDNAEKLKVELESKGYKPFIAIYDK